MIQIVLLIKLWSFISVKITKKYSLYCLYNSFVNLVFRTVPETAVFLGHPWWFALFIARVPYPSFWTRPSFFAVFELKNKGAFGKPVESFWILYEFAAVLNHFWTFDSLVHQACYLLLFQFFEALISHLVKLVQPMAMLVLVSCNFLPPSPSASPTISLLTLRKSL